MTADDVAPLCRGARCSNPSAEAFLCRSCVDRLVRELLAVEDLVDDLLVTVSRLDAVERAGRPDPEPERRTLDDPENGAAVVALPYRTTAADAGRDLHGELGTWVRHLMESRGLDPLAEARHLPALLGQRAAFPGDDTTQLARWLARHPDTIAQDEAAGDLDTTIRDAVRRVRSALDVPELDYYGPCSCSPTVRDDYCHGDEHCRCGGAHGDAVDLYAPRASAFVRCRECGASYPGDERRAWLREQARAQLVTASMASRALPTLLDAEQGRPITARQIRTWGDRGDVRVYVPDPRDWYTSPTTGRRVEPEPRYSVGELLDHVDTLQRDALANGGRLRRRARPPIAALRAALAGDATRGSEGA